jgi:exopolysaccharide biosynthesis polyprenyl glycosylphosphotransferase
MHTEWVHTTSVAPAVPDASTRRIEVADPTTAAEPIGRLDTTPHQVATDAPSPAARRPTSSYVKAALVGADVFATAMGLALATLVYQVLTDKAASEIYPSALVSLPLWPLLYAQQGLYQARRLSRRVEEWRRIVNAVLVGVLVVAGLSVLMKDDIARGWLALAGLFVITMMTLERELARRVISELRSRGGMTRRVVVVGRNAEAEEIAAMLGAHAELGYEVVGFVADQPGPNVIDLRAGHDLGPYLGAPRDVLELVRSTGATGVIVATTGTDQESANRLIRDLTREGVYVELTSAMRDIAASRISVRPLGRYPIMSGEPVAAVSWRRVAKRVFDIIGSALLLLLASPVIAVAALAIRLTSGPGVLFRQQRVGRDGELFTVYKLRTMVQDAEDRLAELHHRNEAPGPMFKMADDPRVTPVGRFLRKTSIDELPQLFNVIMGDMSLVGPRPALPVEAEQWNDALRERLRVQPGITGMWQVSGRYTTSMETYARLDLYYVDNWSLVTDVAILLKTIAVVVCGRGGA